MSLTKARVIKGAFAGASSATTRPAEPAAPLGRRVPRESLEAREEAARVVAAARAEADAILSRARASVAQIAEDAAREARELELAKVTAELVVARAAEERRAERELDRTVELAVLLAERLVGEALRVDPERVAALANEALRETRGARRVRIEACPEDAEVLARALADAAPGTCEVLASSELERGSLVVHTELGRIDARLGPQLARLAEALREGLRGGA